jgi:hypothetical protein
MIMDQKAIPIFAGDAKRRNLGADPTPGLLSTFAVGNIPTEALMFQTGYLTIDQEENRFGEYGYRLRYPNQEVYQGLTNHLLRAWTTEGQPLPGNHRSDTSGP